MATSVHESHSSNEPPRPLLLNVREVAQLLGCGKTYVYELIARRELPALKLGRLTRIPRQAVDDFVLRKLGPSVDQPAAGHRSADSP
ncbi:MAG: helix-turn-helix domain-containing protein [Candidatus Dormibacteria bacterium]